MKTGGNSRTRIALARRINRVLHDRESGAAEIAADTASVLVAAAANGYSTARMDRLKTRLAQSHPAMASVWNAVHAEDPQAFASHLRKKVRETIRLARKTLPKGGTVITLSYSSSVIGALARNKRHATVAESLPGGEGHRTARALKHAGLVCTVIPDAAMATAAADATFGIIGADAIASTYVVNKVGSHLLALACQTRQIPLYVVADSSKFVPPDWAPPTFGPKTPFEAVPRSLVTMVISA